MLSWVFGRDASASSVFEMLVCEANEIVSDISGCGMRVCEGKDDVPDASGVGMLVCEAKDNVSDASGPATTGTPATTG